MEGLVEFITSLITFPFICIGWLIVGFLAGGMARYFMRSENRPFYSDIVLGLAGGFLGGLITGGLLGLEPQTSGLGTVGVNLVIATLTAMALIFIGRRLGRE